MFIKAELFCRPSQLHSGANGKVFDADFLIVNLVLNIFLKAIALLLRQLFPRLLHHPPALQCHKKSFLDR